jgi:hypothetical protein
MPKYVYSVLNIPVVSSELLCHIWATVSILGLETGDSDTDILWFSSAAPVKYYYN